jgi:hypothetical protein
MHLIWKAPQIGFKMVTQTPPAKAAETNMLFTELTVCSAKPGTKIVKLSECG